MLHNIVSKSTVRLLFIISTAFILLTLAACGGQAPLQSAAEAPATEPAYDQGFVEQAGEMEAAMMEEAAMEEPAPAAYDDAPADTSTSIGPVTNSPNVYRRLIIKNAELALTVEETDTAINRGLGIVTEYNGYVVSNRTWFSGEHKFATLSIGVPAENFEEMLRRLKDLAVSVDNETVSGQDVTDEFVDLESRLRNLEATAARIRTFMDQATDVEESLAVSAQLSNVEAEIEQIKGRMNYL
ncbi:MAG: DUF4349 domain-containing protein, partial [Anaerolineae bacterium]|nr:DUF4349 domain-containing protein [Anaerolineae bacterium]